MKKILCLCMVLCLSIVLGCGNVKSSVNGENASASAQMQEKKAANDKVMIKMLDIGQGDAILIKTPEQTVLIDTGDVETRDQIVSLLKKEKVDTIDKLIITHPHADHLGGAYAVLKNFKVKQVYDNGQPTTNNTYKTYMSLLSKQKIAYKVLNDGDKLDFGNGVQFKVFSPTAAEIQSGGDLNNNSIVGKMSYGSFSMLFTGDCEAEREKVILEKYPTELKSTILKSPHHGSKTSSSRKYLKAVSPEAVLISCGLHNDYKHPHDVTLNKYKDMKLKVYRTDLNGSITIMTDGKSYDIAKEKS